MKRILSLDGGGVRGVFSLQILHRLQELFRAERGKADLVLADVFDMFVGASTGAIIAAFLSWGKTVAEVESMYIDHGTEIFCRRAWPMRWLSKYQGDKILEFFRSQFRERDGSDATLGSPQLRTQLVVVMRNASTGSAWPVSNNPAACFNDRALEDCNLDIPLCRLLAASTAAPTFFPPQEIELGKQRFTFVDGGITPFNNPALLGVLMATLPPYRLAWPAGREALHVVSVGTGSSRVRLPSKSVTQVNIIDQIRFVIPALITGTNVEQDMLCRVLGDCIFGAPIDSEVGDLTSPTLLAAGEQKFTYVRYDQLFDTLPPEAFAGMPFKADLDNLQMIPQLQRIGQAYAQENVRPEHLHPRKG